MSKHTPGPWKADTFVVRIANIESTRAIIADVCPHSGMRPLKEIEANARLIAACPLMYDYVQLRAKEGCAHAQKLIATIGND